ncbi:MAG TPA: DinB family protein [Symbiobacteriaceae bacterium]|nr:DinB family protein [Symbiobacteriaceae bacterium]
MSRDVMLALYDATRALTDKTLALMPEEKAEYRPVPEVFSFRQLGRHVISTELSLIEAWPEGKFVWQNRYNDENLPTLAAVQKALPEATRTFRAWVEARTEAELAAPVRGLGEATLEQAILEWILHEAHHRGQMCTYLRENGIVPPRSY